MRVYGILYYNIISITHVKLLCGLVIQLIGNIYIVPTYHNNTTPTRVKLRLHSKYV